MTKQDYYNQLVKYKENALGESDQSQATTDYVCGLDLAIELGGDVNTKQGLVTLLTNVIMNKVKQLEADSGNNGMQVRALVSALKEALKLEGDLDLDEVKLITPVTQLVKVNGKVTPINFVKEGQDYDELFTLPEVLAYDALYWKYVVEVY